MVVRSTGWAIHHTSKVVHRLLILATGLLVVAACLIAGATWRLAQGPIDLGGLADTVRAAFSDDTDPVHISFGHLALAWEGFDKGVDFPLDLRIFDIEFTDQAGHRLVAAPDAHLTVSLAGLLLGRIVPRTIEVDHAQVAVTREADGSVNLGQEPNTGDASDTANDGLDLRQLREQLARPVSTDRGRSRGLLDQLRRAHFRDTDIMLRDRQSGFVAHAARADLDLVRSHTGHIEGILHAPLSAGDQNSALTAALSFMPGADSRLDISMTPFRPAAVGPLPPSLAMLAQADLPVAMQGTVNVDAALRLRHAQFAARFGSGKAVIGQSAVAIRSGAVTLAGTPDQMNVSSGRVDLAATPDAAPEVVTFSGTATHVSDRIMASVSIGLEHIDIADLPRIWPVGVANGARPWITQHILGGTVTHGAAALVIEADDTFHDVALTKATGDLTGSNTTFTWLDGMPPVEQAEVRLHLVDPDTLDIHVLNAHQRISNRVADLAVKDGQMRINGLTARDQTTKIRLQVEASVANALAFLTEPRLHLLSAHPISLKTDGGDASATLDFQFPLQNKLEIDDIQIHADAHLTRVRILDVAGGHQLDDGVFDLGVGKDNMTVKGHGVLAAIPVTLDGTMDFTTGTPDQVIEKITVTGQPDAAQLDAAGLPVKDVLTGPVAMTAVVAQRRGGDGTVSIAGDLTQTAMKIGPLAWSKPPGVAASATGILLMSHDRLSKIDRIVLQGDNLQANGSASFTDGHIRTVLLDKIRLGRTQGHGTIHISPRNVIDVVLQGRQIDLLPKLTEKLADSDGPLPPPVTTPVWTLDAHFDQAILANGESAGSFLAKATGGGDTVRTLDAVGATQGNGGFSIRIEPRAGKRHLLVDAKDAGRFLRGINAMRGMQDGHLTVDADFGGPNGFYPLAGALVINDVVMRNSPLMGKLLQAITLYGLVDVLRGPGMTFSSINIPFRYDGTGLMLTDAHANNASLGLTATGRIGLSAGQTSINGTIVPAYFFNSMLGQLPLVGKLFSPEKGGGIFAARFGVSGDIEDPTITINPISALTPGFLREIFNIFDKSDPQASGTAPVPP